MKILITGSEGFVGKHAVEHFGGLGYEIMGFDAKKGDDVRDRVAVTKFFDDNEPDYVLHLAWVVDKRKADRDPYNCFEVGLTGTLNLLEASTDHSLKRFLFMNSSQAYGNSTGEVSEESPYKPENCYARSKIMALYLLDQYARSKNLSYTALTSWELFGEGAPKETIVMRLLSKAFKDEEITLYCHGKQSFDINYVGNICVGYELGLRRPEADGELISVGSGHVVTLKNLSQSIVDITSSKSKVKLEPPRKGESLWNSYPNLRKAKKLLGYAPKISLEEGLLRTSRWAKKWMFG